MKKNKELSTSNQKLTEVPIADIIAKRFSPHELLKWLIMIKFVEMANIYPQIFDVLSVFKVIIFLVFNFFSRNFCDSVKFQPKSQIIMRETWLWIRWFYGELSIFDHPPKHYTKPHLQIVNCHRGVFGIFQALIADIADSLEESKTTIYKLRWCFLPLAPPLSDRGRNRF